MIDFTATKIVATLGPVSESKEMIKNLFESGVTMFRINSSHGSFEEHERKIRYIREIEEETNVPIPILLDLQGPKIRVGNLEEPIELVKDSVVKLKHQKEYKDGIIPVDYEGIAKDAVKGEKIFLDDGKLVLQVEDVKDEVLYARVICGGLLKQRKGINIPGNQGSLKVLTDRDKEYVKFALEHEIDYLGLSFVRDEADVMELRDLIKSLNGKAKIISKIEKPQALKNIDGIIQKSSGIMVARGDLGIEISPERVPMVQKELIRKANAKRKVVIVATQMLESMTEQPIPTRAEASDVANAILDGTDAIMLSGETAAGKYPVEAVKMMKSIADNIEKSDAIKRNYYPKEILDECKDDSIAICTAIIDMINKVNVKAVVTLTASGYTPKLLSKAKASAPILSFCPSARNTRRLGLFSNVYPVHMELTETLSEDIIEELERLMKKKFDYKNGDKIVITGSIPNIMVGKTNFVKIHEIGSLE